MILFRLILSWIDVDILFLLIIVPILRIIVPVIAILLLRLCVGAVRWWELMIIGFLVLVEIVVVSDADAVGVTVMTEEEGEN